MFLRFPLLLLSALALAPASLPGAEPLPRRESNVSIRNEVQLAIDKGLAHLQTTQRADGTWGKVGSTGFALMAFQRDPRGRGDSSVKGGGFEATLEKGYAGLRQAFPEKADLQKIDDFAWNVPPAVIALGRDRDDQSTALVQRARQAIGAAHLPETAETRALFLALDPKNRSPGPMPKPATGSALAAWLWIILQQTLFPDIPAPHDAPKAVATVTAWLSEHYTLERSRGGEGVHQYYFWLTSILGEDPRSSVSSELKLASGVTVDIPRQLAEKLINEQNGSGSWNGVGEHWTEQDPDLVTALCLLTLEQVYEKL